MVTKDVKYETQERGGNDFYLLEKVSMLLMTNVYETIESTNDYQNLLILIDDSNPRLQWELLENYKGISGR